MLTSIWVLCLFAIGGGLGYLLPYSKIMVKVLGRLTFGLVLLLLFLLGHSVGCLPHLSENIGTIGLNALVVAVSSVVGSVVFVGIYDRFLFFYTQRHRLASERKVFKLKNSLLGSLLLLAIFCSGLALGIVAWGSSLFKCVNLSDYTLFALMFLVGLGVGMDNSAWSVIRKAGFKLALLPLVIVLGTLLALIPASFLVDGMNLFETMAVGAGMGYYSLSSVLISQISGEQLGAIALISNIIREVATLLLVPLYARYLGPLAGVASAGATAMDTSLPVIVGFGGAELAPVAIFCGLVLTVLVPMMVPLLLMFGF
jgi:uncharacterized membrane protein YbjE (DUF340 family)